MPYTLHIIDSDGRLIVDDAGPLDESMETRIGIELLAARENSGPISFPITLVYNERKP